MDQNPKNLSAATDLGLGLSDVLKDQLAIQSEAARQAALKKQGADERTMALSPATHSLLGFLNGGASDFLT